MTFWTQAIEVARVDLRVERRLGDTFKVIVPFAAMALLVFPLTLGIRLALVREIGTGIFWALSILFGMQIALRLSAGDTTSRRDLYALLGVDPAARFIGRCISGTLLTIGFLLVLWTAMALLYDPVLPDGNWLVMIPVGLLYAIGTTTLATLAGELTTGMRNRSALAPLLVAPLSIPLVIAASQAWDSIDRGAVILTWMLVLLASALGLVVAGVGIARTLEETTR